MKKEINTLFALIKCAVLGEELCEQNKREAEENPSLLYKMARHHDMAHLLDYAYKTSGIEICDEETAFEFIKQNAMSVMRYENLNFALVSISQLFEKEKLAFIPLKGAVIRAFYPEPWMRTSCDIDVLVHEQDLDRAEKLLVEKLGFTSKGKRNYHDISLYLGEDVHLELHFNIKENTDNIDVLLEKVWDYASPKSEGSYEYVLTNEFLLFQHVAHMFYHVAAGGCSIRYFLDLHLLKNRLEFDGNVLFTMLENCGIKRFYDECIKLCGVWFSDEENDGTTLLFQQYLLGGGVYGIKHNQIAFKRSKQGKMSYVLGRIFMPYKQLIIKYPSLKGKRYLVPFYQVRRWVDFIFKGKMANKKLELSVNDKITDERMENVVSLFEKLGIEK